MKTRFTVVLASLLLSAQVYAAAAGGCGSEALEVDHDALAAARAKTYAGAKAEFVDITHHKDILKSVLEAIKVFGPEGVWVAYDIDDCITYPDHPACLPCSYDEAYETTFYSLIKGLDPVQSAIVWNLKYVESESKLTEDNIPDILKTLKDWGVRTFGLTASMAGALKSPDDSNHYRRVNVLDHLGVHFNSPDGEYVMDRFPKFHRSHPVYYNGVAFAQSSGDYGSATKGEIIMDLAHRWGKPAVVFMVDDSGRNLHRVDHVLKENGIDCRPFKYKSDRVHEKRYISEKDYIAKIGELRFLAETATKPS